MASRHDDDESLLWSDALAGKSGRDYWRGLLDLLDTPEHRAAIRAEFPATADERAGADLDRRTLMKLLGASFALAGLGGCIEEPAGEILPYTQQPPEVTPGVPLTYATSMVLDGYATGVVVESHEGRPTKIEGNPEHPASLGASGVFEQASILGLYDPQRARSISRAGRPSSWRSFVGEMQSPEAAERPPWLLAYPQSSPLFASVLAQVRARHPGARITYHTPCSRRAVFAATRELFGSPLEPVYDFSRADVILSLDADFTSTMPGSLRYARDFASRRRIASPDDAMNRLYVAETMLSPTGSVADHHLAVTGSEVGALAAAIAREIGATGAPAGSAKPSPHADWIGAVARDLTSARGRGLVVAGDRQPVETHILAHAINAALGNLGQTVSMIESPLLEPEGGAPLAELVEAMNQGTVDTVVILGANPVYTAPSELGFTDALRRVRRSVHVSLYENETSEACTWFLPAAHYLETWGDARAFDGTISLQQPLVAPLFGGKTDTEVLAAIAGDEYADAHALLQKSWLGGVAAASSSRDWRGRVQRGFIEGTAAQRSAPQPASGAVARAFASIGERGASEGFELDLEVSPKVYDGRFANNPWLLELPHPMTKLTWDNAAIVSPTVAARLGLETGDVLELRRGGVSVELPALVLPGHADGAVTVAIGYGRGGSEAIAQGVGVDVLPLRAGEASFVSGLEIAATGDKRDLAITQDHWSMKGRSLALHASLEHYRTNPDFTKDHRGPQPTLLPVVEYEGVQWAMTIDTGVCTGCSACVIACQAENNIPVVGKENVRVGREMHWLRIDRYFTGEIARPSVINQPMLCQHCETAPCEYVCPVNATVHSPDGLNEMVYNRCIGTRFCSNNCPYKVRRFNWFDFTSDEPLDKMQRNPNVTVRDRGVMEKCSYCVQRIRSAEIAARIDKRGIRPGEVRTACQQACPTEAIVFGSLDQPATEVVTRRRQPRVYSALHELGTRPRTQYLAKIENLNPEIDE